MGTRKRGRTENLKAWKAGQSGNPAGRPKKTKLTDATRAWLEQVDEKTGLTNAMLVAAAVGKKALKGSAEAFRAIGDRAEGKPQHSMEVVTEHKLESPSLTVVFVENYDGANDRSEVLGSVQTPAIEIEPRRNENRGLAPKD